MGQALGAECDGGIGGKELSGAVDDETEEKEGTGGLLRTLGQAVLEDSGRWRHGSEGKREREEVQGVPEGMKAEKVWVSEPSAGEESLWKLWGL